MLSDAQVRECVAHRKCRPVHTSEAGRPWGATVRFRLGGLRVQGETLRVESSSRGWRRFYAGFIAFIIAYGVVTFAVSGIAWYNRAIPVVLLVGQLPLAVQRFAYAEVTEDSLDLDTRVRRRHIPWAQMRELELGGPYGRPPRVLLADGTEVRSIALGGFIAGSNERSVAQGGFLTAPTMDAAVLDRLEQAAETHGFNLAAR
jgi:hypothetical protein